MPPDDMEKLAKLLSERLSPPSTPSAFSRPFPYQPLMRHGNSGSFCRLRNKLHSFDNCTRVNPAHLLMDIALMATAVELLAKHMKPHYLWNKALIREVTDLSTVLVQDFPRARFVSVGNSPSYIVYGIESASRAGGLGIETVYVPFSGNYVKAEGTRDGKALVYRIDRDSPFYRAALENENAYREFLGNLGMHPQKIMDDFEVSGQKTAFLDNLQSGSSYTSFMHFMHRWANAAGISAKAFAQATDCVALVSTNTPAAVSIPEDDFSVRLTIVKITEGLRLALNGNYSHDNDRFVSTYYPLEWDKPPVGLESKTHGIVAQIRHAIDDAVGGDLHDFEVVVTADETLNVKEETHVRLRALVRAAAIKDTFAAAASDPMVMDMGQVLQKLESLKAGGRFPASREGTETEAQDHRAAEGNPRRTTWLSRLPFGNLFRRDR